MIVVDDCSFLNITASVVISAEPGPTQVNTISNSYFYGIVGMSSFKLMQFD